MTEIDDDAARIAGVPVEKLRGSIASAMTKMASQGSVPAATAVLKLLTDIEAAHASGNHRRKLNQLVGDPPKLARYLGELGVSGRDVKLKLGREMSAAEKAEYDAGANERRIEARALELESARRGQKSTVPEWATR